MNNIIKLLLPLALFLVTDKMLLGQVFNKKLVDTSGIAFSVQSANGDKGMLLPRVELQDLSLYDPILGEPQEGMLVYNTNTNYSLRPGIYMWNNNAWLKQLDSSDSGSLGGGTYVYIDEFDPNLGGNASIANAPIGTIFIDKKKKLIYKKIYSGNVWNKELSLNTSGNNLIAGDGLKIESAQGIDTIKVVSGFGIDTTKGDISVKIDSATMGIDSTKGIGALKDSNIWNASKLQGKEVLSSAPSEGSILTYKNNSWQGKQLEGSAGITITDGKISAKIDSATMGIDSTKGIGALKDSNIWNASKLQGKEVLSSAPSEGSILTYKNNSWQGKQLEGSAGITITDGKISAKIDSATMGIDSTKGIGALKDSNIWNASKLQGKEVTAIDPEQGSFLTWTNKNKWEPIIYNTDTLWNIYGNKINASVDDVILGIIDPESKINLILKTAGKERLKLYGEGKLTINAAPIELVNIPKVDSTENVTTSYKQVLINEKTNQIKIGSDIIGSDGIEDESITIQSPFNIYKQEILHRYYPEDVILESGKIVVSKPIKIPNNTFGEISIHVYERMKDQQNESYYSPSKALIKATYTKFNIDTGTKGTLLFTSALGNASDRYDAINDLGERSTATYFAKTKPLKVYRTPKNLTPVNAYEATLIASELGLKVQIDSKANIDSDLYISTEVKVYPVPK
ncbi:MAG: hypothetical protein ACQPRH_02760 [Solitalea-like symbiont of Tyrophagus putrescentiae]